LNPDQTEHVLRICLFCLLYVHIVCLVDLMQLGCLTDCHIKLERSVGLPELRSLRRTFIKLAGQYSLSGPPPPTDADSAKRMFVDYLNRELGA
jgi:hypothetical protein